jgi:hypothetical protein
MEVQSVKKARLSEGHRIFQMGQDWHFCEVKPDFIESHCDGATGLVAWNL